MESLIAGGAAWIGSPAEIIDAIARAMAEFGNFEHASLQVSFNLMPYVQASSSLELFARDVMPQFSR
jgi:hypothetical protein